MDTIIKARLKWVKLYEEKQDAGYVCRHCGISRPTLRKWFKRYQENGIDGLSNQSKRPHSSPNTKINDSNRSWILSLRTERNLGARRIQSELLRLYQCSLGLATIQKVLPVEDDNCFPISTKRRVSRLSPKQIGPNIASDHAFTSSITKFISHLIHK